MMRWALPLLLLAGPAAAQEALAPPEPRTQAEAACRAIGNPEQREKCLAELHPADQPAAPAPPAPAKVPPQPQPPAESPQRPR